MCDFMQIGNQEGIMVQVIINGDNMLLMSGFKPIIPKFRASAFFDFKFKSILLVESQAIISRL